MFEVLPLSSLAEKQQGGGTPPRNDPSFWHGDIPWASVKDFKDDQLELQATEEKITSLGLRSSSSRLIPPGIPMVCTRMAVGRCAISSTATAINQDVRALYPREGVNSRYLLRLISSLQSKAESLSVGSTVKGIRTPDFLAIETHIAPEQEQGVIAHILDTLDTQIQKTEALIAKLEKVKEGLFHDLLTRGIDESGQLRPNPEQAPGLYKESPLGLIPREWEVRSISAICSHIVDCPHSTPIYRDRGVLVARTTHIKKGSFLHQDASRVSESEYQQRVARLEPESGDIVFTREAPVGEAFIIPKGMRICLGQRVMLLRPDKKVSTPEYIVSHVYSGRLSDKIQSLTAGTTNPHLNVSEVGNFFVPIPKLKEQKKINAATGSLSSRISGEKKAVDKLAAQKSGLMDDLLTGRVRVTSLLDQATTSA